MERTFCNEWYSIFWLAKQMQTEFIYMLLCIDAVSVPAAESAVGSDPTACAPRSLYASTIGNYKG